MIYSGFFTDCDRLAVLISNYRSCRTLLIQKLLDVFVQQRWNRSESCLESRWTLTLTHPSFFGHFETVHSAVEFFVCLESRTNESLRMSIWDEENWPNHQIYSFPRWIRVNPYPFRGCVDGSWANLFPKPNVWSNRVRALMIVEGPEQTDSFLRRTVYTAVHETVRIDSRYCSIVCWRVMHKRHRRREINQPEEASPWFDFLYSTDSLECVSVLFLLWLKYEGRLQRQGNFDFIRNNRKGHKPFSSAWWWPSRRDHYLLFWHFQIRTIFVSFHRLSFYDSFSRMCRGRDRFLQNENEHDWLESDLQSFWGKSMGRVFDWYIFLSPSIVHRMWRWSN